MAAAIERTLIVVKPDGLARGLVGRIVQRFEDAGLKIVASKMRVMDAEFTRKHYFDLEERLGKEIYDANARAMQRGPVLAMVLEGVDAAKTVRRLVGATDPSESAPGTIRGDFAHQSREYCVGVDRAVANLVHASGNADEAKYEIDVWFSAEEQYDYSTAAEPYTF